MVFEEDLGFFPKNELAFLAFLAFSLLKPRQNGFFLMAFLAFCPKSPAFLAFCQVRVHRGCFC